MTNPTHTADPVLALLMAERAALLAVVARVPADRQNVRPTPNRWSAAEIVEHVAIVDRGIAMILALRSAEPLSATHEELAAAEFTAEKVARVRSRTVTIMAPQRSHPTGTLTMTEALDRLASERAALLTAWASADPKVLDGATHPHPHPAIGPLTVRGWFTLLAHHDARHAQQIAELIES